MLYHSAGVAPDVNLRNSLHTGNKAQNEGIYPGLETQGRCYQKPKNRGRSGHKMSWSLHQTWKSSLYTYR